MHPSFLCILFSALLLASVVHSFSSPFSSFSAPLHKGSQRAHRALQSRQSSMEAKTSVSPEAAALIKRARDTDPDILASTSAFKRIPVEYRDGETPLHGVAVWQDVNEGSSTPRPAVLVVHTAVGLEEDFMDWKLEAFASLGFVAFGVDMFGKGRALWDKEENLEARAPLKEDRSRMAKRMLAAYDAAQSLKQVDPRCIAAAGFCFGGMAVLDLARSQLAPDLKASISFHGILDSPPLPTPSGKARGIDGRVLVLHGEADPFVPADQVRAFKEDMASRGAEVEFVGFPGVLHSFTRPEKNTDADRSSGLLYDEEAAMKSWAAAKALLQSLL